MLAKMNYIIFLINSICSIMFLYGCIVGIIASFFGGGSPFTFIGGIAFSPIPIIVLLLEWAGTIRKKYEHLRTLGVMSLVFSGFVLFAYITSAYEAIQDWDGNSKQFLIWFSLICGALTTYSILSGIYRIILYRKSKQSLQAKV